jgi:hypothetical protein
MEEIRERQSRRFRFLKHLYDETQNFYKKETTRSNQIPLFSTDDLGDELGFTAAETEQIVRYLSDEGLVKRVTGKSTTIAHRGVIEVEDALTKPDQPTDHFPPNVVQYIVSAQQITNSSIQQGTVDSIIVTLPSSALADMREFIETLRSILSDLPLSDEDKAEATAEMATIESQLQSPRPKRNIIRTSLETLMRILRDVPANVAANIIAANLPLLIEQVSEWVRALS